MFGICNLSVIPCRVEPSDKSEMVTQLLFGEHFKILQEKGNWFQIKSHYDGYEGWIDKKQFAPIKEETYKRLSSSPLIVTHDLVEIIASITDSTIFPVVIGSNLPDYKDNSFGFEDKAFTYDGNVNDPKAGKNQLIENAFMFLNTPYLWGGRSPFGIDCSGFTQIVYKLSGVSLKRDAYQQAEQGTTLSFIEEAEPGDLAFFDNEEGRIIHVGIILKNHQIIHASGKVRVDSLDHHGIHNAEQRKHTHRLRLIKKII